MTGLSADRDQIVEIAAAVWDPVDLHPRVWSRVVRATVASTAKAHEVHKISQEEIDAGESVSEALASFLAVVEGRVLVGHSPGLDLQFLERVITSALPDRPAPQFALDTLVLARRALRAERYTLESLCKSLGIVTHRSHRAADDALATAALFAQLAPMFGPRDARDLWQVRVGQQREVSVRSAIAERIERDRDRNARVEIVVRQGGSAPRTIRGVIEQWESPHVRVRRANATPVLLRADRILRIDEIP
jgi:DNA polymerase-3 subunit epsilon